MASSRRSYVYQPPMEYGWANSPSDKIREEDSFAPCEEALVLADAASPSSAFELVDLFGWSQEKLYYHRQPCA